MKKKENICYVLHNNFNRATYCGFTNDHAKRLRQHNSEIKGGAKTTTRLKGKGTWSPLFHICGFETSRQALQFEWAMKHRKPPKRFGVVSNTRGVKGRIRQLEYLLSLGRLNKEFEFAHYIRVECFMNREQYLRYAGITYENFISLREQQGIYFLFRV